MDGALGALTLMSAVAMMSATMTIVLADVACNVGDEGAGASFCSSEWTCCGLSGCCAPGYSCCPGSSALPFNSQHVCVAEVLQFEEADEYTSIAPMPARGHSAPGTRIDPPNDGGGDDDDVSAPSPMVVITIILSVVLGTAVFGTVSLVYRRVRRSRKKKLNTYYMGSHVPLENFSIEGAFRCDAHIFRPLSRVDRRAAAAFFC